MLKLKGKVCRYCGKPATQAFETKVGFSWKGRIEIWYLCDKGFKHLKP